LTLGGDCYPEGAGGQPGRLAAGSAPARLVKKRLVVGPLPGVPKDAKAVNYE